MTPIVLTAAMIAIEMPAAMRPYSIAVAPDSFFKNATIVRMGTLQVATPPNSYRAPVKDLFGKCLKGATTSVAKRGHPSFQKGPIRMERDQYQKMSPSGGCWGS